MNIIAKNILLLFFFSCILFPQQKSSNLPDPIFDYITMEDGLPENAIEDIVQDNFGYLWLATGNGLVKYDGYEMVVYSRNIYDTLSISSSWITTIYEDRSGKLWVGTGKGLNSFDRKSEIFTRFLNSVFIQHIYEDAQGQLWVATDTELLLLDRISYKIQRYRYEKFSRIYAIAEDITIGTLYLGTDTGLYLFDLKDGNFQGIKNTGAVYAFYKRKNEVLWIGSDNGLIGLDFQSQNIIFSQSFDLPIRLVIEDDDGFVWCYAGSQLYASTGNELIIIDPQTGNYKRTPSEIVMSMYKDRSGIIWVGTGWANLKKWDKHKWKFRSYKHEPGNRNSLSSNHVWTCYPDSGDILWIGTKKGLDKFDRQRRIFKHYSFKDNEISAVYKDKADILWLGTIESGLIRFDPKIESFQFYQYDSQDKTSLSSNDIPVIYEDSFGELWVGTRYNGFNRLDRKTGKFKRYLPGHQAYFAYEDFDGDLWLTTSGGGLYKFNRITEEFTSTEVFKNDFEDTPIIDIYEDRNQNFWVGIYYTGIHLFDKEKGISIKHFSELEGLPNNCTFGIAEDNSGNLWMKTFTGIVKLNPQTESIRTYYSADGLPVDLTGFFYPQRGLTGEIFIGGFDGLFYFHPDSIKDDPFPPQVLISNLSLFNQPDETLSYVGFISEIKEIILPYNHNDLRFDFVALHFGEPSKNNYKYILENFDDDWVDAGTQRNATYTNLSSGEYTFRVIACNRDGVWNEEGASLKLIISPPFWATWWAYTFYVILFGSILYGLRRYEMNRVNLKNQVKLDEVKLKEKEETDRMKSRFFANISHEFRTPLTLILGPTEKIINEELTDDTKKQAGIVKRNASQLLGLVNQLLDLSKLEAGKLNLQASKGNIVSFVKGITMSFESLAERKGIHLQFISEQDEIELYFDRDKMAKILTNLLSNAFKFTGEGGEITVALTAAPSPEKRGMTGRGEDGKVEISVRDTGIGISEEELPKLFDRFYQVDSSQTREHEGTGIGLALTKELVELHKGNIKVNSKVGKGSEFIVELPIGRAHLSDDEIVDTVESEYDVILSSEGTKNLIADVSETTTDSSSKTPQNDNEKDRNKTIALVVEDNADVRAYIKDSLGNNFQIEEAANGEIGVEKAKEIIPDLIISDIMMPKMDGNELTRRIKNDERTSHIPVILLTAKSEQESKLEGLETGADDYLTKPFDTKELKVRIRNLISIRKKLQEKFRSGDYIEKYNKKKLSSLDEKFLAKVNEIINNHISEEDFSIEEFNKEIGMGRIQIYRKLKALTGNSPSRYIRLLRLTRAKQMIKEKQGNISEIAYSVGFSSPQYFARCFKEEFGYTPSDSAY